jgi:hypothetical protein
VPETFPEAFPAAFFGFVLDGTFAAPAKSSWSRRRFLGALLALDFLDFRGAGARRDIISKLAWTGNPTRSVILAYSQEEWEGEIPIFALHFP